MQPERATFGGHTVRNPLAPDFGAAARFEAPNPTSIRGASPACDPKGWSPPCPGAWVTPTVPATSEPIEHPQALPCGGANEGLLSIRREGDRLQIAGVVTLGAVVPIDREVKVLVLDGTLGRCASHCAT
jgi:hypothetical protein